MRVHVCAQYAYACICMRSMHARYCMHAQYCRHNTQRERSPRSWAADPSPIAAAPRARPRHLHFGATADPAVEPLTPSCFRRQIYICRDETLRHWQCASPVEFVSPFFGRLVHEKCIKQIKNWLMHALILGARTMETNS